MKKILAVAILAGSTLAMAGKYGTAGCGIGALAFGDQKGPIQIVAATVNNILVPQTSAITTGTSNCTEDGVTMVNREREIFAEANFNSLKEEMSQGAGENVAVLASLYGCQGSSVSTFSSAIQSHYTDVGHTATSAQMLEAIDGVVRSDASLATTCSAE